MRFLTRSKRRSPEGDVAQQSVVTAVILDPGVFYDPDGFNGCPHCGEMRFHRSHRGWFERSLLRHPPMVRCSACGYRFPAPQV
jgi:hypothetical protein